MTSTPEANISAAIPAHAPRIVLMMLPALLLSSSCSVNPTTGAQSVAGIKISDDPCAKTATAFGAVLGAAAGAILANQISHRTGAKLAGAGVGGAIGGLIGHDVDRRRCEYFKIAKKYGLNMTVMPITVPKSAFAPPGVPSPVSTATQDSVIAGLSASIRESDQQFAHGSDQLAPQASAYFAELAAEDSYPIQAAKLARNAQKEDLNAVASLKTKRILLIGHTDDTGDSRFNADLSERRALAVARVFRNQGIPETQLFYQGAGETLPIADNRTEEGRAKNRRVEIVDVTDDASFQKYLATRRPHLAYFRGAPATVAHQPTVPNAITSPPVALAPSPPVDIRSPPPGGSTGATYFDFGGNPATTKTASANFGNEIPSKHAFSVFPSAYAAEGGAAPSCSTDRPRVANGVKSLRDQKSISITEYMPGLYRTSWMDTLNGNAVGIAHVAVFRDGGSPAEKPNLYIYRDYQPGAHPNPDFTAQPEVNTYRGDKALLYRVFVDGPIRCMDIVFPYENTGVAQSSFLYYDRKTEVYVASFMPRIVR